MRKSGGFAVVCLPHASFAARKVPAFLLESKGKANRSRRRESAGHWAGSALLSKDYTTKWLGMEEEITDRKAETDKKCAHARNHVSHAGHGHSAPNYARPEGAAYWRFSYSARSSCSISG